MFTSTRPVSILYLRGTEHDDPDLHPVALVGEPLDLTKVDSRENAIWQQRSGNSSVTGPSLVSPSPSSISSQSQGMKVPSGQNASGQSTEIHSLAPADVPPNPQQLASPPDQLTKVPKTDAAGNLSGWIQALGVDSSYEPPVVERPIKPVACFYVLLRDQAPPAKTKYHRAVYLMKRTLKDFTNSIAGKWNLEPTKIMRTLRILESGLEVEMDDDVIRELAEGQDFIMDVAEVHDPVKREWEMSVDVVVDSDDLSATQNVVYT